MGAGYFSARSPVTTPPAHPVDWRCTARDGRTMTVTALTYFVARAEAVTVLGVGLDEVTVERVGGDG